MTQDEIIKETINAHDQMLKRLWCIAYAEGQKAEREKQAEQEPVAWRAKRPDGSWGYGDSPIPVLPFDTPQKLYAAPVRTKDYNPDVTFNDDGTFSLTLPDDDELRIIPPQQEPVAWFVQYKNRHEFVFGSKPEFIVDGVVEPLYAAPVRTKDLTDAFINELHKDAQDPISFARAVIAADREKNK